MNRKACYSCLKGGLSKYERHKQLSKLKAEKMVKHKVNLGCSICGYNKCGHALEWHHKDPDEKEIETSMATTFEKYLKETEKCILLCANCHRELHNGIIDIKITV